MSKIGLKKIKESLLIRKAELARMANISPMTVARIEQGHSCRKKTKRKVALALEHKISWEMKL
jgi:predicted transcriptional regulator